jgi:hypothetical protein
MRIGLRRFALSLATLLAFATAWSMTADTARAAPDAAAESEPADGAGADLAGDAIAPSDEQARPQPAGRRGARYGEQQAEGSPYFFRQMLLALVIVAGMVGFLAWLVRRNR